jgi:segregation and condensation protein A
VELLRELAARGEGEGVDIDTVGDFLVVAATLLEIKSNELLPCPEAQQVEMPADDQNEDPRFELVRQLLEYKRIKDSADRLEARREMHQQRFPRFPGRVRPPQAEGDVEGEAEELPPLDLEELHAWDLLTLFEQLMADVGRRGPASHEVTYDDTPIDLHVADIADRVGRERRVSFRALMLGRSGRSEMIGVFLALLELIRQKRVLIEPVEGDVQIVDAPEEHKKTFEEQTFGASSE